MSKESKGCILAAVMLVLTIIQSAIFLLVIWEKHPLLAVLSLVISLFAWGVQVAAAAFTGPEDNA